MTRNQIAGRPAGGAGRVHWAVGVLKGGGLAVRGWLLLDNYTLNFA